MPIINWALKQNDQLRNVTIVPQFYDPRGTMTPSRKLEERLQDAIKLFPCDVLFIHRDAEREPPEKRRREIDMAIAALGNSVSYWVPVIPVRMTEAWLLIDEKAIRQSADNPNGNVALKLPRLSRLESEPDPKEILNQQIIIASEKSGRRLEKLRRPSELAWRRGRVAELINDYRPLRSLDAFQAFAERCLTVIDDLMKTPRAP
jgi:hypothetical protein